VTVESAQQRLAELAERYALSARQGEQLEGLLSMLAGTRRAPTSVRSPEQAVDAHIADSLVALELEMVQGASAIADLGSGAGFPGLPLAIALDGSRLHVLESQMRKCLYLETAIAEVRLANARVVCARAEEWIAGHGQNDVVLARALAQPAVVLEYAAPLLRRGGVLVDWRGKRSSGEERRAGLAAEQLGMQRAEIRSVVPFVGARDRHLHVYVKVTETPPRFPRRAGVASRRPLAA
jgi:16S rRNA (guanine527-N7)-methyltransferase